MWAHGLDRKERPAAECGLSGPMTETRADELEGSLLHTWGQRERERVKSWLKRCQINLQQGKRPVPKTDSPVPLTICSQWTLFTA